MELASMVGKIIKGEIFVTKFLKKLRFEYLEKAFLFV